VSGWRTATSLLTRLPVGMDPGADRDLARAVPWLPVVGGLVGLTVAGVDCSMRWVLPADVAAAFAVVAGVLATGALHEDGLADTVDALAGGRTVEDRIAILDDPRHGTYGVLAISVSVVVRVLAIGDLASRPALVVLPAAHALARVAAALLLLVHPARDRGLGASYVRAVRARHVFGAAVVGLSIAVVTFGIWSAAAIALLGTAAWSVAFVSIRRIGGVTGDVLGAVEQVVEIGLVLLGVALVRGRLLVVPWWR
jgi:adenosylcobinamide-GDP ribazoletransferase